MQRLQSFLTNYRVSVPTITVVIAGVAWLAFGYFGVHTLFIDDEVSEALPTFDATPAEPAAVISQPAPSTEATEAVEQADTADAIAADADTADADAADPAPVGSAAPAGPDEGADDEASDTPTRAEPAAEIVTEFSGQFTSDAHPTSGQAIVLGNGTGQRFLRFEDFRTDNGPDLNVYLVNSSTGDVSDFVDLGDLSGNIGEQNYEIPADVDLTVYDQVVIWCVRFGVGFGDAELMAA